MKTMIVLLVIVLVAGLLPRATVAVFIAWIYERFQPAEIADTPFTDIDDCNPAQKSAIGKLYGLGITVGTSATTFSPKNRVEFYQYLLFTGRTIQVLKYGKG